jgi:PAS domain S-box-containing protein
MVVADRGIVLRRRYQQLMDIAPQGRTQESLIRRSDGSIIRVHHHRQATSIFGRWVIVLRTSTIEENPDQRTETSFRNVVELSGDAIGIVDVERQRLIEVNPGASDLLGYSREEMLAIGLPLVFAAAREDELKEVFAGLIAQAPRARVVETELHRRDGSHVPVQITQQAVDDHGRWVVILTARDITERVEARRALEQRVDDLARSNQELERFAYVASHDLMEPLRMMASYTQLLDRRYRAKLDADTAEFIDFIVGGARRMKQLLDDLLAYSRVGRTAGAPDVVPIGEVLDDVIDNLQVLIEEKGALVERGRLPSVRCTRTEVAQLLQNLIGNALKFQDGSHPAEVRVDAVDDGRAWTFSVRDNGIGIAPTYFDRIFVVFQRLHERDSYGGTGIGLAICKKIVEHHGGRIWVESEPGVGTAFHFTLPHQQLERGGKAPETPARVVG